ncbi:MAG: carboxypeptidase regulatory-like domain-containing protein, partial [Vicinamibacteraceae bacterium]
MRRFMLRRLALFTAGLLVLAIPAAAQVTTATLYGLVVDESGSVLPGATVTVTHEGTAATRTIVTNQTGAFALSALPIGTYTVKIEMQGFKTQVHTGLQLGSAQSVRRTYQLGVGEIAEDVTVEGVAPLVNTTSSEQLDTIGRQQVSELPSSRRNVTGLLRLAPGVDPTGGHRGVRFNGVGKHGAGITVDGTDANSNPEGRGISQYGGENYIDIMSIEAVQEVQLVRGIMPAEYGGVVGGQVNLISRSGTNAFHGSIFENYIGESLNARDVFLSRDEPKPAVTFNQFGGSLGGPVLRNRAFFFGTYEGYREEAGTRVQDEVPTPQLREQILEALPYPETEIVLNTLPLPTEPIDEDIGFFVAARNRERRENHVVAKGEVLMLGGGRLSVTYTRMRPFSLIPNIHTDGSNDRVFLHAQDRVAANFVKTFRNWVSESRFGYNRNDMERLDRFFEVQDPSTPEENLWGRRIGLISVGGLFSSPSTELWDMEGTAYSVDQKASRTIGNHLLKLGVRWMRQTG